MANGLSELFRKAGQTARKMSKPAAKATTQAGRIKSASIGTGKVLDSATKSFSSSASGLGKASSWNAIKSGAKKAETAGSKTMNVGYKQGKEWMSYTKGRGLTGQSKTQAFASDLGSAARDLAPLAKDAVVQAGIGKTLLKGAVTGGAISGAVGVAKGDDFWDSASRGAIAGAAINVGAKGLSGAKSGLPISSSGQQVANSVKTWAKNTENNAKAIVSNGLYKGR